VSKDVIEHKLQVNPVAKPRKLKLHKMSEEKVTTVKAEVQRLLGVVFIREVTYPEWLVNVVMHWEREKWKMENVHFYLNKCCPTYDFPLTRIDKIIDYVIDCEMMSLLDYFSYYHQIWFCKEDEERTSFITPFGTCCYLWMHEGMQNTSPTFYRMMKVVLKGQVGRNIFTYVDDIVVTSEKKRAYISDLTEKPRICMKLA
jgi:hypothetical protein